MLKEVATEIMCILRYKPHAVSAIGLASEAIKAEFAQHAKEEQMHLDLLAGSKPKTGTEIVLVGAGWSPISRSCMNRFTRSTAGEGA